VLRPIGLDGRRQQLFGRRDAGPGLDDAGDVGERVLLVLGRGRRTGPGLEVGQRLGGQGLGADGAIELGRSAVSASSSSCRRAFRLSGSRPASSARKADSLKPSAASSSALRSPASCSARFAPCSMRPASAPSSSRSSAPAVSQSPASSLSLSCSSRRHASALSSSRQGLRASPPGWLRPGAPRPAGSGAPRSRPPDRFRRGPGRRRRASFRRPSRTRSSPVDAPDPVLQVLHRGFERGHRLPCAERGVGLLVEGVFAQADRAGGLGPLAAPLRLLPSSLSSAAWSSRWRRSQPSRCSAISRAFWNVVSMAPTAAAAALSRSAGWNGLEPERFRQRLEPAGRLAEMALDFRQACLFGAQGLQQAQDIRSRLQPASHLARRLRRQP
jgi:hypothetical protein